MISCRELQNAYIHMYENLRNYIWGFKTVEHLANLEVAIYSSFPDLATVNKEFNALYLDIREMLEEDEDLSASVKEFKDILDNIEGDFYLKLDQVQEVV